MMKDILNDILVTKRIEVARQKQAVSLQTLLALGYERMERPTLSMRAALDASPTGILAEFKRRSPSKGWIKEGAEVGRIVTAYEEAGAAACSILTDGSYFGGSLGDLKKARSLANIPLLRKDFVIDDYQLYQARVLGADAILLIASALSIEACRVLAEKAHSLQLEVLLEVHNEQELAYLNPHIDMLGVNNRNLGTFDTDINNSFALAEKLRQRASTLPYEPLLIAESGITQPETVHRLRAVGFRGFLIGETFMKQEEPGQALADFMAGVPC